MTLQVYLLSGNIYFLTLQEFDMHNESARAAQAISVRIPKNNRTKPVILQIHASGEAENT